MQFKRVVPECSDFFKSKEEKEAVPFKEHWMVIRVSLENDKYLLAGQQESHLVWVPLTGAK